MQQLLTLAARIKAQLPFGGGAEPQIEEPAPVPMLQRRRPRTSPAARTERLPSGPALQIDCPDPTAEDALRDKHISKGQFLVRQERWTALSDLIRAADSARSATPGAMPLADLYAFGARSDVVGAAEHVLLHGKPEEGAPLLDGIEDLEGVLEEHEEDPIIGAIVAHAHMDIGWAWRGNGWETEVPAYNRAVFEAHFDRARDILEPHVRSDHDSPLIAAAHCALLGAINPGPDTVAERYGKLIALDPENPRNLRALGAHLLPRWYGSYEDLELEARRCAARNGNVWGAGAYAWVMFDAISTDPEACARLDVDFFIAGLHDILARRTDPYTANLLAAYCAYSRAAGHSGNDATDQNCALITDCADWIVRDHLTELHPMTWAHAARGFDNTLRVYSPRKFAASGREDALRILTALFSSEIAAGKRVIFTPEGAQAVPA